MNTTKIDTAAASSGVSDTDIAKIADRFADARWKSGDEQGYRFELSMFFDFCRALLASAAPAAVVPEEFYPDLRNRGLLQAAKQALSALDRHGRLPWGQPGYPTPNPGFDLLYEAQGYLRPAIKREEEWRAAFPDATAPAHIDADKLQREIAGPMTIAEVHQAIREAGGIVHSDGNIFFTRAEQFIAAAVLCREQFDARQAASEMVSAALGGGVEGQKR